MLVVALRLKVDGYRTEEHLYGVGDTLATLVKTLFPMPRLWFGVMAIWQSPNLKENGKSSVPV